ncbi:hypothetical protein D3C79_1063020 [compost metagenome]
MPHHLSSQIQYHRAHKSARPYYEHIEYAPQYFHNANLIDFVLHISQLGNLIHQ